MGCRINHLVNSSFETLEDTTSIQEAAAFMADNDLGSVIVTRDGKVIGLFTENDLIKRVIGPGKDPEALRLKDVCSRKLISVHAEASYESAINTMNYNNCRRLLVYRGETLSGIVTLPRIAAAMAKKKARSNVLLNVVGGMTLVVTLLVIGFSLYQLPQMARISMAVLK